MRHHVETSPKTAVRRLAAARLISITGGAAAYTALMYTIYERTGSATWLSATLLLTFGIAGLFAPLGGALGDRFDGLLIGTWGAGSVLGSLAGRKLTEEKEPRALFLGMALIALSTGAIAVSPWFAPILVMSFMSGFGDAVTMVAEQGIQQRRTPDAVRSRVVSASEAMITVAFALSLVAVGPVLEALGPQNVYAIGGATALAGSAVLLPVLRGERRRSVLETEPTMQVELG